MTPKTLLSSTKPLLGALIVSFSLLTLGQEQCDTSPDADGDGWTVNAGDCDDSNPDVFPGNPEVCDDLDNDCNDQVDDGLELVTFYPDNDGDGFGGAGLPVDDCAQPEGYVDNSLDCNDRNADINPDAEEVCDGVDNDCNNEVDDAADAPTWYPDKDADGYGANRPTVQRCDQPEGYVDVGDDCDDTDPAINPGAEEVCNGIDDNCDGRIDEGMPVRTWYPDADVDGFGDESSAVNGCERPEGYILIGGDCDDANPDINPGVEDICNGIDDNCDGVIAENGGPVTWYPDRDNDGYGAPRPTITSCEEPPGYVNQDGDCDDNNSEINPGMEDICDGIDNDCDGDIDDGQTAGTFYRDADGDGYGVDNDTISDCMVPEGYAEVGGDCNDGDATVNPEAEEVCDHLDNNCNDIVDEGFDYTTWYRDRDGDGYGVSLGSVTDCNKPEGYAAVAGDCDDQNADINPGAQEICNGIDDNCDGQTDEGATGLATWYKDADGDGYGVDSDTTESCEQPSGYAAQSGDCDDGAASVHPYADEICDGVDQDCDGTADEDAIDGTTYYADMDGDTYGDATNSLMACSAPTGFVADNTDCDDSDEFVHPGAVEEPNGIDDNCNGIVDDLDCVDNDQDGWTDCDNDCNDADASINPGATEICDGVDQDCDGTADNGLTFDKDNDGYTSTNSCAGSKDDCNDNNANINPGASELCNGKDDNCNGQTDEGMLQTFYADGDGDGFGDAGTPTQACTAPTGYVGSDGDCDDDDATVYPDAEEVCDGVDNNCDGDIDEGFSSAGPGMLMDEDGDGFGGDMPAEGDCLPEGMAVSVRGDCDDMDSSIFPGATDAAGDGVDQDCGGTDGPEPHVGLGAGSLNSIAAAISAAQDDTFVWVGPGTYFESGLSFGGKAIILISTDLADDTVVNGSGTGPIFSFTQGEDGASVLDGFTLTEGSALKGGAVYIENSSPTISHCVLYENFATDRGGALFAKMSAATIKNTLMEGNSTDTAGKGGAIGLDNAPVALVNVKMTSNSAFDGGAMYMYYSEAEVHNTVVSGNYAANKGGAAYTDYSSPRFFNSVFSQNESVANGGAFFLSSKTPNFRNCLIVGNQSGNKGGGMHLYYSSPTIAQCVVVGNTATTSVGGINVYGGSSKPTIFNSIFAYNSSYNIFLGGGASGSTISLTYTDLYNPTGDNHNVDPLAGSNFVVEPGFNGYGSDGLPNEFHLALSSSLIDVGENTFPDADDSVADLGIFGGQYGGDWDLDADDYANYFWPGNITNAPSGFSAADYDRDDMDPYVH